MTSALTVFLVPFCSAKGRRQSPEKKQQQLAGRQGGGGAEKEAEGRQAEGQEAEEERVGTRGWRGEAVVDDMGTLAFLTFAFWWPIIAASSLPAVTVRSRSNFNDLRHGQRRGCGELIRSSLTFTVLSSAGVRA